MKMKQFVIVKLLTGVLLVECAAKEPFWSATFALTTLLGQTFSAVHLDEPYVVRGNSWQT